MTKKELLKRYILFTIGLFVNALGVSLITKASLGTSPISSIPYTLSMGFPLTMGQFTFILNLFLILGQIIFLRKDFKKIQLMQIPVSVLFGYFIDLTMSFLGFLSPIHYWEKIISLIAGCLVLAFGVSLEVIANVVMLSGEAFVNAISMKFKKEFGITKICFDTVLTICACITSMIMFQKITGVREGTIIAALLVGFIAKTLNKHLAWMDKRLRGNAFIKNKEIIIPSETKDKVIVTIGREYGSGGHEIGEKLANELNIPFYDKETISYSAKETSFDLQCRRIKELAAQGSCVIVGRCADYVLQGEEQITRVFIHANEKSRMERTATTYNFTKEAAKMSMHKNDMGRKSFYKRYTGKEWGEPQNYHLMIDSSVFGIDGTVRIIKDAVKKQRVI